MSLPGARRCTAPRRAQPSPLRPPRPGAARPCVSRRPGAAIAGPVPCCGPHPGFGPGRLLTSGPAAAPGTAHPRPSAPKTRTRTHTTHPHPPRPSAP